MSFSRSKRATATLWGYSRGCRGRDTELAMAHGQRWCLSVHTGSAGEVGRVGFCFINKIAFEKVIKYH